MPVSALPSPYGIGTLGQEARAFVDFLARAGQRWWQILPVGPTGYGDSPYQSFSAYEGNPYTVTSSSLNVTYSYLPDGVYLYCFCIEDAFGDYYFTGSTQFEIDVDGTIYFD